MIIISFRTSVPDDLCEPQMSIFDVALAAGSEDTLPHCTLYQLSGPLQSCPIQLQATFKGMILTQRGMLPLKDGNIIVYADGVSHTF